MASIAGHKDVLKVFLVHLQVAFSTPLGLQMTASQPNSTVCLEITVQPQPLGRTVQTAPALFEASNHEVKEVLAHSSFC